jgi:hypothetical protein
MQPSGLTVLATCVLLCSCSIHVNPAEIPGEYFCAWESGNARLSLRPDRTYEQVVTFGDGGKEMVAGTWEYDQSDAYLTLSNVYAVGGPPQVRERVAAALPVTKILSTVHLEVDPDGGTSYRKQ